MSIGEFLVLLGYALALPCGIHALLTKTRGPTSAMAWILVCFMLPLVGSMLYLTIGQERIQRKRSFRIRIATAVFKARMEGRRALDERMHRAGDVPHRDFIESMADSTLVGGNSIEVLHDGDETYPAMLEEIGQSKSSVNLQFFIIEDDRVGGRFQQALIDCARRKVEVRVLYDAIGCHGTSGVFFEEMEKAGVQVAPFMPISLFDHRHRINLRNHRKLVVVDGRTAFTGSLNLSACHVLKERGTSHDLAVRVKGPLVALLQRSFARDWYFGTEEDLSGHPMFGATETAGDAVACVVESGPDRERGNLYQLLVAAIHRAESSVTLLTPYFVPGVSLLNALESAARRGIDVTLVVPRKSDNFLIDLARPNFLQPILRAGARVLERPGPMLHIKLTLIDDDLTVLGSTNLDNRSFFLNFELDLVISGRRLAAAFRELADAEIRESRLVSPLRDLHPGLGRRLMIRTAALFAPIL